MRRFLAFFLVLSMAMPVWATPPGSSEEMKCKDLGGGFAKINVRPVRDGGATAIEYHNRGLTLFAVPSEGVPFTRMSAAGACYDNGRIPQKDKDGAQVYLGVTAATGVVESIANCDNEVETPFRAPIAPAAPLIGLQGPTGATGPQGPQGLQGPIGPTGPTGAGGKLGTGAKVTIGAGVVGAVAAVVIAVVKSQQRQRNQEHCSHCLVR